MTAAHVQIILKTDDTTPENYISNTFCITYGTQPDGGEVKDAFKAAYDKIAASYWSEALLQNGHGIKISEIGGSPPIYPWYEGSWSFTANPSGGYLPPEVALCLSFQGEKISGETQKRRRGRVYLGPLGSSSLDGAGRPQTGLITDVQDFAHELADQLAGITIPGCAWAVWSPTNSEAVEVTDGWVDNEYDTQRRRGLKATTRNTWTI